MSVKPVMGAHFSYSKSPFCFATICCLLFLTMFSLSRQRSFFLLFHVVPPKRNEGNDSGQD